MKALDITKQLELLCFHGYRVAFHRYHSEDHELEVLRQECRRIRLIADRLQRQVPDALPPLPVDSTDSYLNLALLLVWIHKALRIQAQYQSHASNKELHTSDSDSSWDQRAMRLRNQHPNWRRTRIARELGAISSTYVRSKLFSQAMTWDQKKPQKPIDRTGETE